MPTSKKWRDGNYSYRSATIGSTREVGNAGLNPAATDTSASSTAATADEKELRAVPAEQFGGFKGQGLSNTPVPIAGDKVLPQSIQDTFAAGKSARATHTWRFFIGAIKILGTISNRG